MQLRVHLALLLAIGGVVSAGQSVLAQHPYAAPQYHAPPQTYYAPVRLPAVDHPQNSATPIDQIHAQQPARQAQMHAYENYAQQHASPYELTSAALPAEQSVLRSIDAIETSAGGGKGDEEGWIDVSNEQWRTRIGGLVHMDYVLFTGQDDGSAARFGDVDNYFEFRRIRLFLDGEGYGVFDYRLELDFEPDGASLADAHDTGVALLDAYVGMRDVPLLGYVRAGHFKEPMSIEQLTYGNDITFMERSMADIFAPARNVGIAAYNNNAEGSLGWAFGVFFEDALDRFVDDREHQQISDNQGIRLTPRVFATPYYCEGGRHLLHVGTSLTYVDDRDDMVRFSARPEVHESARFVDSGLIAAEDYITYQTEGALVWGPASLQGEFFYTRTNGTGAVPDFNFYGAYAYISYFITKENRQYDRRGGYFEAVRPHSNFWIVRAVDGLYTGPGAWEVAVRWSYLDVSDSPFNVNSGQQNDLTLGVNWYWNPQMRMMFNWIHAFNEYNVAVGGSDKAESDSLGMRMQFDF